MKEYGPHFNEHLSLPPELSWNLKTDRRSAFWIDRGSLLIFVPISDGKEKGSLKYEN